MSLSPQLKNYLEDMVTQIHQNPEERAVMLDHFQKEISMLSSVGYGMGYYHLIYRDLKAKYDGTEKTS